MLSATRAWELKAPVKGTLLSSWKRSESFTAPPHGRASAPTSSFASLLQGLHLHARVVVAGALADVGVVCGAEGRDGLTVVARAHPCALEARDHAGADGVGDSQGQ